jgi:hypothetical protein
MGKFEAKLATYIQEVRTKRSVVVDQQRALRTEKMSELANDSHDMCCDECPRRVDWQNDWDDAEHELEESEAWKALDQDIAQLEDELRRLESYQVVKKMVEA